LQAYILINTEPAKLWEIAESCKEIQGVKMAHAVTGQFDVVAYADHIKMDDLKAIIEKIQNLEGVKRTQTVIAIPPTIRK
jgi:DNA-binding Lrp family transcriptional regulator